MPKMIRYYLGEEPILNNAPTYLPFYEEDMKYVLEHFDTLESKYLATVAGGEIDARCQSAGYREIGRDADMVVYERY